MITHILGLLFELLVCELVLKLFGVRDNICEHLTAVLINSLSMSKRSGSAFKERAQLARNALGDS